MLTTAAARLDLRLNPADKTRISRAANLRGMPVSTFVRDAVLREAEHVIAGGNTMTLSPTEVRQLLSSRLCGRATSGMSTDQIMQLTRDE